MPAPTALFHALVDYAGLFPPAKLPLREAMQNYASYLAGPHRALLGRFVVPLGRLDEFSREFAALAPAERAREWQLSVLTGPDGARDWAVLQEFSRAHDIVRVTAVETKASTPDEARAATNGFPSSLEVWIEIAADAAALPELLATVREHGRGAKIRTGGVTADAFPPAGQVVRFFRACRDAGVTCKATAGLHHAWRGEYRLTYEPESPRATMHGFLNVFLAAALLHGGGPDADAIALLEDRERANFTADSDAITWRGHRFDDELLASTRRSLCRSFGSCSFTEPVQDLQELHWL